VKPQRPTIRLSMTPDPTRGGMLSGRSTFGPDSAPATARPAPTPAGAAAPDPPTVRQVPRARRPRGRAVGRSARPAGPDGGGLAFILAGAFLWTGLGILGLSPADPRSAAPAYLWATGLVFPLALLLGRLPGHDVLARANPLGTLGASLSGLQVSFFPVLPWAYLYRPSVVPWFLGALTGAHFLPFG
jgi:hypothetical protein